MKRRRYFVFHGVTRTRIEVPGMDAGVVNSNVVGYGRDAQTALADAERRERQRYGRRFLSFGSVAHVSGPWEER